MHLGRCMKGTEKSSTVTGKCCYWQLFAALFKVTLLWRSSFVVMVRNQNMEDTKLLVAGSALFDSYSCAFFLFARLTIGLRFFFIRMDFLFVWLLERHFYVRLKWRPEINWFYFFMLLFVCVHDIFIIYIFPLLFMIIFGSVFGKYFGMYIFVIYLW